jgi:hypothetical protein
MRQFIENPGMNAWHITDLVGTYGIGGTQELDDRIRFIRESCIEKDISKHWPGPHFTASGMTLTPAFKAELAQKAEEKAAKRVFSRTKSLKWIAAKTVAGRTVAGRSDLQIPEHLQYIVEAAKPFAP